jgi:predicted DNA-binding mobile mystery protein A
MTNSFKKLMREQVQERLSGFLELSKRPAPPKGWIRTIREALGMSGYALANRLGCSKANIVILERNERRGAITLETLDQAAQAMGCKLVYCLVPQESLDAVLEQQAMARAKKKIALINHSMKLEKQGLSPKQLKQQEADLIKELLQGPTKNLWIDDEV